MKLNMPTFAFTINEVNGKKQIFDPIRKRYVTLTPEEWVRQNFIQMLIIHYSVPTGLMGIEKSLKVGVLTQRADIVIYNRAGKPILIVEVKAPSVIINQAVLDQASRYNINLKVKYLILTNGVNHLILKLAENERSYIKLDKMPQYAEM